MAGTGVQTAAIALQYIPAGISGLVVVVRIWRKKVDRALGGDDYTIILAWCLGFVQSVLMHMFIKASFGGYYPQDIPREQFLANKKYAAKIQYAFAIEYTPIVSVVKLSFLWSLQRLRSGNIWVRRSLWTLQIINFLQMLVATLMNAFPCIPYQRFWDKSIPGTCLDNVKFIPGIIGVVLATDILVLIIPTWMIYDLQMPLRRKLISISFLSLGIIVFVLGVLRLEWLLNRFKGIYNNHSVEQCYTSIEWSVAIIGACGPTVKYILSFIIPCLRSAPITSSSAKPSSYGNSSQLSAKRTQRSKYDTRTYNGLDDHSVERVEIEMKGGNEWAWVRKDDFDAKSDEERIAQRDGGITRTVDWSVETGDRPATARAAGMQQHNPEGRTPVQPANVL